MGAMQVQFEPKYVTIGEAARRVGRAKKTLQNWIADGKLRGAQGLYYLNGRPMIEWAIFEAAFLRKAG